MEKAGDDIVKAVMKELRTADDYTVLEKIGLCRKELQNEYFFRKKNVRSN